MRGAETDNTATTSIHVSSEERIDARSRTDPMYVTPCTRYGKDRSIDEPGNALAKEIPSPNYSPRGVKEVVSVD